VCQHDNSRFLLHLLKIGFQPLQLFVADGGHGVQTEVVLSYLVTNQLSIGVGGRYWAMWTQDGQFTCTGCQYRRSGLP